MAKLKTATDAEGLARMQPEPGKPRQPAAPMDPEPHDGEIHVLPLRNNVYMLVGDGGNIVVQMGDEGAFVVDSGTGALADKTIAAIRKLIAKADSVHRQHRLSRGAHRRQRESCGRPAWIRALQGRSSRISSPTRARARRSWRTRMSQNHMDALKMPADGVPSDTFLEERRRKFHNGDSIEMF